MACDAELLWIQVLRDSTGPDLWPFCDRESLEVSSQNVAIFFYRFYLSILQLYFNFDTVTIHQKAFTIPKTQESLLNPLYEFISKYNEFEWKVQDKSN